MDRTHQILTRFIFAALIVFGLQIEPPLQAGLRNLHAPTHILSSDGFVRNWLILGPFPNPKDTLSTPDGGYQTDYLQSLGSEAKALLTSKTLVPFEDENGNNQNARTYHARAASSGIFHLDTVFKKADYKLAYAFCYIRSDKDRTVTGYFGSNDDAARLARTLSRSGSRKVSILFSSKSANDGATGLSCWKSLPTNS